MLQDHGLYRNTDSEGLHRNTDSEGLQVVEQKGYSAPWYPQAMSQELPDKTDTKPQRQICGLRRTMFWLICVIAVLVIAGAVGGGVGGALASRNNNNANSSSASSTSSTAESQSTGANTANTVSTNTATSTASSTSSAVTSGVTGMAENPCPSANQTTITASSGSLFTLFCSVDWPKGAAAADGNGTVEDLYTATAYTLKNCIEECVSYNKENDNTCKAVEYQANLTSAIGGGQGGNCFLKSRVGTYSPASFGGVAAGVVGG